MDELNKILIEIMDVYESDLDNDNKYNRVSELWTRYYKRSFELGKELDFAKQIYLLCENECYKINEKPIIKNIDSNKVKEIVSKLKDVLEKRKIGIDVGISREEAIYLLDWAVNNARLSLQSFGINIENNSLNGFCEIVQALTIMPFENCGVKVTKNRASDAFGYRFNHAFGTVTLPIYEDGKVISECYLLDPTYRQFFSSVRCNDGRYYTFEENTGLIANPDPGFFVKDKEFASKLLKDGYILLDRNTALLYGEGFYLSSFNISDLGNLSDKEIDYYKSIMNSSLDYVVNYSDIEGFDINFPDNNNSKKNHR